MIENECGRHAIAACGKRHCWKPRTKGSMASTKRQRRNESRRLKPVR